MEGIAILLVGVCIVVSGILIEQLFVHMANNCKRHDVVFHTVRWVILIVWAVISIYCLLYVIGIQHAS